MKKFMTLSLAIVMTITTSVEAKRGGGVKVAKTKPSANQQQNKQDADFNNTPPLPNNAATQAQQTQRGAGINNFVTGAAAGYLLSNMLAPTEAQAQGTTQAVTSEQHSATASSVSPTVPTFKSLDPTDPNVIERNANYSRYCLGGMQYIVSGSKAIILVDSQNQPQRCAVTP